MAKKIVSDLLVKDKKVLIRVDFNVPIKDGVITDDNRIVEALPTIKYLLENGAKLIAFSHLGKVKTEEDKKTKSLKIVSEKLSKLLNKEVKFIPNTRGKELEDAISNLKSGEILMFENTRFEDIDGKKESGNDKELGKYWASLGDLFVNDAFGTAHRAHASNVGIAENIGEGNSAVGFLVEKEIKFIGEAVDKPSRPFIAILGGAKVSDKIGVIDNLITKADYILIGGAMMFTFLKSQGKNVGKSLVEDDKIDLAKQLLEKSSGKIILPVDTVVAETFSNDADYKSVNVENIPDNFMGLDIGEKTISLFNSYIKNAKTIIWNGPMGVFEMSNFAKGTIGICESISRVDDCITVIGGGDSAAAAISLGYRDKFSHISTGGGASLEYLEGKELPGIKSISNK